MVAVVACLLAAPAASAFEGYQLLRLEGQKVKWGNPRLGTGAKVTFAYVSRDTMFPNAVNCGQMTSLDGLLVKSGIASAELRREVNAAFSMWEKVANIEFRESDDPATAQILIGAQLKPRWTAFANVASRSSADGQLRTIDRSLICLNPTKAWKIGFSRDLKVFDLRYTIAHEIGHAIGLDHSGPSGQLMSFKYLERFRELQPGDVAGALILYGRRSVPLEIVANGTLVTAHEAVMPGGTGAESKRLP